MTTRLRLPSDVPLDQYPSRELFVQEGLRLVEAAQRNGLMLRMIGGVGIYLHCQNQEQLWTKLARFGSRVFADIDFAGRGNERGKIAKLFTQDGYALDPRLLQSYGLTRQIYHGTRIPMIEVFYDRLAMNHKINFKGRFEADSVTLPVIELLLTKLQTVKIAEKDLKDLAVLLREHEIGYDDADKVNMQSLKDHDIFEDWGFYYTATTNLNKLKEWIKSCPVLSNEDTQIISSRVDKLLDFMNEQPKSVRWRARGKIGTRKKWYNEVEEWSEAL